MVTAIKSGAQTGADIAGLDAGLALGLMTGGWIPKGRRTDEGPLSHEDMLRYRLKEHSSWAYPPRTRLNVAESDGTVLFGNMSSPGCSLTIKYCKELHKPYICNPTAVELRQWTIDNNIETMNTAGNRASTNPRVYQLTYDTIVEALK